MSQICELYEQAHTTGPIGPAVQPAWTWVREDEEDLDVDRGRAGEATVLPVNGPWQLVAVVHDPESQLAHFYWQRRVSWIFDPYAKGAIR